MRRNKANWGRGGRGECGGTEPIWGRGKWNDGTKPIRGAGKQVRERCGTKPI